MHIYQEQKEYSGEGSLLLAQNILNEAQSSYYDESQRGIDTLRKAIGVEEYTALLTQVEPHAQQIVDKALSEGGE